MSEAERLEELLAAAVEHRERHGELPSLPRLGAQDPALLEQLEQALGELAILENTLSFGEPSPALDSLSEALPEIDGFRTIERLGAGGMGEVFKLVDLNLGRTVAAKILRRDRPRLRAYEQFLREARSLALFKDPSIVQIYELCTAAEGPVIVMEYVDGFELGEIGPSLDLPRRVELLACVAETIHRAHQLGIQHRDLKPSNILVDAELRPKIVDFGLSDGEGWRGHGQGTPGYAAPEQLVRGRALDRRVDVYALGVVLYELLCGQLPFAGEDAPAVERAVCAGRPPLPLEIDPSLPEPLQAIALAAIEVDPERRTVNALELARDLRRFLAGQLVRARPSRYAAALAERVRPHLREIERWRRLRLVGAHEARRLADAYGRLRASPGEWIVHGRSLELSQIALYLGAFLLLAGGLFYFAAHRLFEAGHGLWQALLVLGLPIAFLHLTAERLSSRDRRAISVAFHLAGAALVPLLLLVIFHELGLWPGGREPFFGDGSVSNRQLQVAMVLAALWSLWLGQRTRTLALGSLFASCAALAMLAMLTDFGLSDWLQEGRWDLLALHLLPLLVFNSALGWQAERRRLDWLALPLYLSVAWLLAGVLELLALNGRAAAYCGWTFASPAAADLSDPTLLATVVVMTLNGVLIYLVGSGSESANSPLLRRAGRPLVWLAPFALLEPALYLSWTGEYATVWLWGWLALALGVAFLSHFRQHFGFYFAGLTNVGLALLLIADRYEWLDVPGWAMSLMAAGILSLAAGVALEHRERRVGLAERGVGVLS